MVLKETISKKIPNKGPDSGAMCLTKKLNSENVPNKGPDSGVMCLKNVKVHTICRTKDQTPELGA